MNKAPGKAGWRPETEATLAGRDPARWMGTVNTPVVRASTIVFPRLADLLAAQRGEYPGLVYGLHGVPTVTAFQEAVASLEGGYRALAVPSGLTATALPLLALASPGDHVLVTDAVYGPTRRFCELHLKRFGVQVEYYDPLLGAAIAGLMKANTRVVFTESPGSLTFEVQDLPAIAGAAHERGALVVLDNSWATPCGFASFTHGIDVAVHAATKYIGGHSDVLSGVIVANEATWPRLHRLWTDLGVTASPDDCFLALRGLRTLPTRLARHRQSALQIAAWLRERSEVAEVLYPALPGARGHELWKRDFAGASGLFGVILDRHYDEAALGSMLDGMQLFSMGFSWGGFESLILPTWPQRTRSATSWQSVGSCLRLAVGLEDPADLIADLDEALGRLKEGDRR